jgi:hypothetical protein
MTKFIMRRLRRAASGSDLTWRYGLNRGASLRYRMHTPKVSDGAVAVVRSLQRDGIAILGAGELLGNAPIGDELTRAARQVKNDWAERLDGLRDTYHKGGVSKQKPYSIGLLGPQQTLSPGSVFNRFALAAPVVEVVNAYFGMYAVLTHCDIWHNFVAAGEPCQSQLWHRDPEDRHILKLFYYLSDVDEGAGPLTYARGSHRQPGRTAPYRRLDGETPRSDDAQLSSVYPPECWVTAYGAKGTLVFADTRGYHKGGWSLRSERTLYLCEFLSPAAGRGFSTEPRKDRGRGAAASAPGAAA